MTNVSLLDEFIGSTDHIVMNPLHSGGGGHMMIEVLIVFLFDFLQSVLKVEGNELVKLICSIEFARASIIDHIERFENEFNLGVEDGNLLIDIRIKLCNGFVKRVNFGNNKCNIISEF